MPEGDLHGLSRLYGIQPTYMDVSGQLQEAREPALLRTLQALGCEVRGQSDVSAALHERRRELWTRFMAPAKVVWDGLPAAMVLRMTGRQAAGRFGCELALESGRRRRWEGRLCDLATRCCRQFDGTRYIAKNLPLPRRLPVGYHRLTLEAGGQASTTLILSAPSRAYEPPSLRERLWGVFVPLYALHRQGSDRLANYGDLADLMKWTSRQGGHVVATLPLLASTIDQGGDPSPYSPVSRLFWNELYLDTGVRDHVESGRHAKAGRWVDYPREMAAQRAALMAQATAFFTGDADRGDFDRFVRDTPSVLPYARFRAVMERQKKPWPQWPAPLRRGEIHVADYDPVVFQYHLYVQWLASRQLASLSRTADKLDLLWYLDLPVGVGRDSFDAWAHQGLFVLDASVGAPPDPFFSAGQDWGFPPLHPWRLRQTQYQHLIDVLRSHFRYARMLRLDHVMALHRLYWIPRGLSPKEGVYVHYPIEELFGVLSLESHRHRALVVGENLGTVSPAVDRAMSVHGVCGLYVLQSSIPSGDTSSNEKLMLGAIPAASVASVNTHDHPPFAAFWNGRDIADRADLKLLTPAQARQEARHRRRLRRRFVDYLVRRGCLSTPTQRTQRVLEACLRLLASGPAQVVLVNLEDLWGEVQPQNTPGTSSERCNWRRRARHSLDVWVKVAGVQRKLRLVMGARKAASRRVGLNARPARPSKP